MTPRQQQMALITEFDKLLGVKTNRNTAKWAAQDLIDSYGVDHVREILHWYASINPQAPTFGKFANKFEELESALREKRQSDAARAFNRKLMEERLAKSRSESHISGS